MRASIWLFLLVLVTSSCDKNRVYENTVDFHNAYWLADSVKTFDIVINDADKQYNIMMSIRNGAEYPHSNVYIQYSILDSVKNVIDEELRNFQLFHPKTGYPLGNGSGNIYEHQIDLLAGYYFPYNGHYSISFEQNMRYDSLPQVYSIGVRVEFQESL